MSARLCHASTSFLTFRWSQSSLPHFLQASGSLAGVTSMYRRLCGHISPFCLPQWFFFVPSWPFSAWRGLNDDESMAMNRRWDQMTEWHSFLLFGLASHHSHHSLIHYPNYILSSSSSISCLPSCPFSELTWKNLSAVLLCSDETNQAFLHQCRLHKFHMAAHSLWRQLSSSFFIILIFAFQVVTFSPFYLHL